MNRLDSNVRRALIIDASHEIACNGGLMAINFQDVAESCAVPTSVGTVRRYFHTIADLRRAVVRRDAGFASSAKRFGLL